MFGFKINNKIDVFLISHGLLRVAHEAGSYNITWEINGEKNATLVGYYASKHGDTNSSRSGPVSGTAQVGYY